MKQSSYIYAVLAIGVLVLFIYLTTRQSSTPVAIEHQQHLGTRSPLKKVSYRLITSRVDSQSTKADKIRTNQKIPSTRRLPNVKADHAVNIQCTENDKVRQGFLYEVDHNLTVTIPNKERLLSLTHEEAASLYHRITEGIQDICQNQIRLGNVGDGGYYVCEEKRPPKPCLIYSFGIRNDFSFDDDVTRRYGCEVHSFDPGMNKKSFQHSKTVFFHDTGIAGKDDPKGKWRLLTLQSIRKELGHLDRNIDILKIDTEGAEWDSLENMLGTGELGQIPQILLEFHLRGTDKRKEYTRESYIRALGLIREMNRLGYRIFYNQQTWNCEFVSKCSKMKRTNCMDLGFILRS